MPAALDLTGSRYGRLLVKGKSAEQRGKGQRWDCLCDCGREVVVSTGRLRTRLRPAQSCGCTRLERVRKTCIECGREFDGLAWQHYHSRVCFERARRRKCAE